MTKINHDHKCQGCGKPATINLQENYQLYDITAKGKFPLRKEWHGNTNEFWCEKCGEEQGII